jgi:hypothetical protein
MKSTQRVVGWGAVGFGALCVFVGAIPFFQGIHWEGIFVGLGSFATGAWILAGPELRATIRKGVRAWRETRKSSLERFRGSATGESELLDPLLAVRILKLARQQHGILTVAQAAIELDVPLDQAQAGMDECVRAGNAVPDYDIARGHPVYRFPEFTDSDPHLLN